MMNPNKAWPVLILAAWVLFAAVPSPHAGPAPELRQGELLIFRMMILVSDGSGSFRAPGGRVAVETEGAGSNVGSIDADGLLSFTIPAGVTSRVTFSGAFAGFTLRFEFIDGFMSVFNEALPQDRQEARVPYYLNLDGSYVVAYSQDYLRMMAPAEPGAMVMGPFAVVAEAASGAGGDQARGPVRPVNTTLPPVPTDPPEKPHQDPKDPCRVYKLYDSLYTESPGVDNTFEILALATGTATTIMTYTAVCVLTGTFSPLARADGEIEIPTLEISLIRPDGSLAFLEWLPVGGSGIIGQGFQWATSLEMLYGLPQVIVAQELSPEFTEGLQPGRSLLAYRFINSQGAGSNYHLIGLEKD